MKGRCRAVLYYSLFVAIGLFLWSLIGITFRIPDHTESVAAARTTLMGRIRYSNASLFFPTGNLKPTKQNEEISRKNPTHLTTEVISQDKYPSLHTSLQEDKNNKKNDEINTAIDNISKMNLRSQNKITAKIPGAELPPPPDIVSVLKKLFELGYSNSAALITELDKNDPLKVCISIVCNSCNLIKLID